MVLQSGDHTFQVMMLPSTSFQFIMHGHSVIQHYLAYAVKCKVIPVTGRGGP
jgi:hypothetical protein